MKPQYSKVIEYIEEIFVIEIPTSEYLEEIGEAPMDEYQNDFREVFQIYHSYLNTNKGRSSKKSKRNHIQKKAYEYLAEKGYSDEEACNMLRKANENFGMRSTLAKMMSEFSL